MVDAMVDGRLALVLHAIHAVDGSARCSARRACRAFSTAADLVMRLARTPSVLVGAVLAWVPLTQQPTMALAKHAHFVCGICCLATRCPDLMVEWSRAMRRRSHAPLCPASTQLASPTLGPSLTSIVAEAISRRTIGIATGTRFPRRTADNSDAHTRTSPPHCQPLLHSAVQINTLSVLVTFARHMGQAALLLPLSSSS